MIPINSIPVEYDPSVVRGTYLVVHDSFMCKYQCQAPGNALENRKQWQGYSRYQYHVARHDEKIRICRYRYMYSSRSFFWLSSSTAAFLVQYFNVDITAHFGT